MKKFFYLLFLFALQAQGQGIVNRASQANTVQDSRLAAQWNFILPRFADTTTANTKIGLDSCGAMIFTYDGKVWKRICSPKQWIEIGTGSGGGGGSGTGTVTSAALTMPSAFSVSGSPITGAGTFSVTGAGATSQYIRGNGTLATFPTTISTFTNDAGFITASALTPYLTTATAASTYQPLGSYLTQTTGDVRYYTKTQADARYLQSFTELDPKRVASAAFSGTTTKTLTLTLADASTVTASFTDNEGTAGGGITSLNGLSGTTQTFATGTTGTNFSISSSGTAHTFNLPTASASNRGLLSSTDWTTFNNKLSAESDPNVPTIIKNIPVSADAATNKYLNWDGSAYTRKQIAYSEISGTPTGGGTLTNLTATNGTGQTWTITNPTTAPNLSLALTSQAVSDFNNAVKNYFQDSIEIITPSWVAVNANYSLTKASPRIAVDNSAGAISIALPTVSTSGGVDFWIDVLDTSHAVTLTGNIEGQTNIIIKTKGVVVLSADLTTWRLLDAAIVPPGGNIGQILSKKSGSSYDLGWIDAPTGGGGGGGTDLSTFPICKITQATAYTHSAGDFDFSKVPLDNVVFDSHNGWDNTNHYWTVPTGQSGTYFVTFKLRMPDDIAQGIGWGIGAATSLGEDDSFVWDVTEPATKSFTTRNTLQGSTMIQCNAGDHIQMNLYMIYGDANANMRSGVLTIQRIR